MFEMGLSQAALAKKIGVSPSRICDFLSGKAEPTLQVGRRMATELKIDPAIVLGVWAFRESSAVYPVSYHIFFIRFDQIN